MTGRPRLIIAMEVLTMNVSELSAALQRLAAATPELTLAPHGDTILVSDEIDVAVAATGPTVQIAEPNCGEPIINRQQDDTNDGLEACHAFIDSLQPRRDMLKKVTSTLLAELPDFPSAESHIHIFRLAELCDVHVTTVARTIQGKTCHTSAGRIPYSQFITNMRK